MDSGESLKKTSVRPEASRKPRIGRKITCSSWRSRRRVRGRLSSAAGTSPAQRQPREARAEQQQRGRLRYGRDRADVSLRGTLVTAEGDVVGEVEGSASDP